MLPARRELTLLLTDLYVDAELRESATEAAAPPLPALERVLARASSREAIGWHDLALRIAGAPPLAPIPVAAFSRAASGDPGPGGEWWLATAVELRAGHDHVQLAEVLRLRDEEWALLVAGFNETIATDGFTMERGQGSDAYLRCDSPLAASTTDPERIAGRDVHDALPGGAQGHVLRRLMTETQMWLHDHPLNRERAARAQAPVTAFWFWGGGALPPRPQSSPLPALIGADPFLRGLWRWAGADFTNALPDFQLAREALRAGAQGCLAAVSMRQQPGASWAERLVAIDRDWLSPALAALRARAIAVLRVQASDALFTVRASDVWRIWRRPRPWLEALA